MRAARKKPSAEEAVIQRALERLRGVLHERALKMSRVREAIARAALNYDGHFSVDHLLGVLHAKGVHEAHMATVYRALPLMVEAGLIQPALVSRGEGQLYEATFEREHHDHLVCTGCGAVIEFQSDVLEALQREIAERHEFELDYHVHELIGRCKACRRGHGQERAARPH